MGGKRGPPLGKKKPTEKLHYDLLQKQKLNRGATGNLYSKVTSLRPVPRGPSQMKRRVQDKRTVPQKNERKREKKD